jgi:hypothetical protein
MQYFTQDKKRNIGESGQAMLIAVVMFLAITSLIAAGLVMPVLGELRASGEARRSTAGYYAAEGLAEDAIYRIKNNLSISTTETLTLLNSSVATATIATPLPVERLITVGGERARAVRNARTRLVIGGGASFNFGVQTDNGGLVLENSSSIRGNVYSNGPIDGSGSNLITGDVVSAGASGLIEGIHATGTAYAHTIQNSDIDKDAYYVSISGTTVGGISYPGSPDQPTSTLPIDDDMIAEWEADALDGGVYTTPCPYIVDSNTTLGPIKINCDLTIKSNGPDPTITLNGTVWVSGNITIQNNPIIRVKPSLTGRSVTFLADNISNRTTSSKISLENSPVFQGAGTGSYILLLSANTSASTGGSEKAITVKNFVGGDVLVYAGKGEIQLENNTDLKEVTAWRVRLKNSTEVLYETGLASLLFTGGPGGSFSIDSWQEIE